MCASAFSVCVSRLGNLLCRTVALFEDSHCPFISCFFVFCFVFVNPVKGLVERPVPKSRIHSETRSPSDQVEVTYDHQNETGSDRLESCHSLELTAEAESIYEVSDSQDIPAGVDEAVVEEQSDYYEVTQQQRALSEPGVAYLAVEDSAVSIELHRKAQSIKLTAVAPVDEEHSSEREADVSPSQRPSNGDAMLSMQRPRTSALVASDLTRIDRRPRQPLPIGAREAPYETKKLFKSPPDSSSPNVLRRQAAPEPPVKSPSSGPGEDTIYYITPNSPKPGTVRQATERRSPRLRSSVD